MPSVPLISTKTCRPSSVGRNGPTVQELPTQCGITLGAASVAERNHSKMYGGVAPSTSISKVALPPTAPVVIFERSDAMTRGSEGFPPSQLPLG